MGVFVDDHCSDQVKETLTAAFLAAYEEPDFQDCLAENHIQPLGIYGEEDREYIQRWQSISEWLLEDAGSAVVSPAELGIPRIEELEGGEGAMKKGECGFCYGLLGLSLLFLGASLRSAPLAELTITSDGTCPLFVSVLCLGFSLRMVLENRGREGAESGGKPVLCRDILVMFLILALYIVAILLVHCILATLLFTVLSITYLERGNWRLGDWRVSSAPFSSSWSSSTPSASFCPRGGTSS